MKSRSGTLRGPLAGRLSPARALALLACVLLLGTAPACSKAEDDESVIQDIVATLHVDAEPGTTPAIVFREVPPPPGVMNPGTELVFMSLVLKAGLPITYDGVTIEVRFNPGVLQFAGFDGGALGACPVVQTGCQPFCQFNGDGANDSGTLVGGIILPPGCTPQTISSGEQTLMTLGFAAQAPITVGDPVGRIELIQVPTHGDSELLINPLDLGVTFLDLNAAVSAVRR